MKKIVTKQEKMRTVELPSGEYYTVTRYQTLDGEIFSTESMAIQHEIALKYEQIEKKYSYLLTEEYCWYRAKNEEELEFLLKTLNNGYDYSLGSRDIETGKWFTVIHSDGGDYKGSDLFITFEKLKSEFFNLMKELEDNVG